MSPSSLLESSATSNRAVSSRWDGVHETREARRLRRRFCSRINLRGVPMRREEPAMKSRMSRGSTRYLANRANRIRRTDSETSFAGTVYGSVVRSRQVSVGVTPQTLGSLAFSSRGRNIPCRRVLVFPEYLAVSVPRVLGAHPPVAHAGEAAPTLRQSMFHRKMRHERARLKCRTRRRAEK